jgi:hypothetical protein
MDRSPERDERTRVESERAFVVYDARSGEIVHLHSSTVLSGAETRLKDEDEAQAIELAERLGTGGTELRALAVDPDELDMTAPMRVDLDGPKLVPDERADAS